MWVSLHGYIILRLNRSRWIKYWAPQAFDVKPAWRFCNSNATLSPKTWLNALWMCGLNAKAVSALMYLHDVA